MKDTTKKALYFDHLTATPCPPLVQERMSACINHFWASPTAPHEMGQKAASFLQTTNQSIRKRLHINQEDSLFLTHSKGEAISLLLSSLTIQTKRPHILASKDACLPLLQALHEFDEEQQLSFTLLSNGPRGYIDEETILESVQAETALILLSTAHPGSGVLQPLDQLFSSLKQKDVRLAVDCTPTLFSTHAFPPSFHADAFFFDCRALGSPLGLGAIIAKEGLTLVPPISEGMASSETILRWSVFDTLLEAGEQNLFLYTTEVARRKDLFEGLLKQAIDEVWFLHQEEERMVNLSTAIFPSVKNEPLLFLLSRNNLFASIGGGNQQALSSQLQGEGYAPSFSNGALSFSFSLLARDEEIEEGVQRIQEAYALLKKVGGHWNG